MTDYVRVKQAGTGHELSVPRSHFDAVEDGSYEELPDKAAVDAAGAPLPTKYKTTVTKTASSRTGQSADTSTKEK